MKKDKKKEIIRIFSGLSNSAEDPNDLKIIEVELETQLSEMKEVYQSYPSQNYFNNLSTRILNKAEETKTIEYQPSFAYAFAIAFVILITSQLFNFNSANSSIDYSDLINAPDLGEYLSLYQSSELNDFSEIIDTENDLNYTAYLLNNSESTSYFHSSVENEIVDMLDDNTTEKIFNEILSKKIL